MSLQSNNFYTTLPAVIPFSGEQVEYNVTFRAEHPIFQGHFPAQPIVPGACLVQMAEEMIDQGGHFTAIRNLKFRTIITPDKSVRFVISQRTEQEFTILIHDDTITYAQFTATYLRPHTNL